MFLLAGKLSLYLRRLTMPGTMTYSFHWHSTLTSAERIRYERF
jgi:hypothetical protein